MGTHRQHRIPDAQPRSKSTEAALMAEIRTSGWPLHQKLLRRHRLFNCVTSNPCCASWRQCAADHTAADNGSFGLLESHGHLSLLESPSLVRGP
jgi:hypothetical protein